MNLMDLIKELASYRANDLSFNQYSYDYDLGQHMRQNLLIYLEKMHHLDCHTLLVGEAPGYHGCRWTGVPFTSERIIQENRAPIFLSSQGYYVSSEIHSEQTASIVWDALNGFDNYPLMWNAYPFHPFDSENPMKNRNPTATELKMGQVFLEELIDLFDIENVIAVGKKAESTLYHLGIHCHEIRHPSHGGKQAFIQGLKTYFR